MQAAPRTPLEVIEAQFLLQLLITLFNGPALVSEADQLGERSVGRQIGQVILKGVVTELLDQQPARDPGLAPTAGPLGGLDPHGDGPNTGPIGPR